MGYKYSTISGISIGIEDMIIPDIKDKMIAEATFRLKKSMRLHRQVSTARRSVTTKLSRFGVIRQTISQALMDNLDIYNPIRMMADSGARGSNNQIKQLAGMRDLCRIQPVTPLRFLSSQTFVKA